MWEFECRVEKQGHSVTVISLFDFKSTITERIENQGIEIIYLNKKKGLYISMVVKLYKIF